MKIASLDFVQRDVESPLGFRPIEYAQIAARVFVQVNRDNVPVVAAGVAFFALLSVFPLISASLSIYGYFADLSDVKDLANFLRPLMPESAWVIISDQIAAVVSAPDTTLSVQIIVSLLFALYTAGAGIRAILRAMNVAYGETEKRSILEFYAVAFGMTLGMFAFIYLSLLTIIGIPAALAFLKLDRTASVLSGNLPWVALLAMFMFGSGVVYRFGPSRRPARKRWVVPGVLFTTVTWLMISWGFGVFVRNFGQYEATYGSISAVVLLLLWFWLTAMTIIVGAELNSEMERQTLADTTRGPNRPVGKRRARMADFLTKKVRSMFPEKFPHAPSLTAQSKPINPSAPDVAVLDNSPRPQNPDAS